MKNKYLIKGEITVIFVRGKGSMHEALITTTDLPIVMDFKGTWYADWSKRTNSFYVRGSYKGSDGKRVNVRLHRRLINPPPDMLVDHFNHNTLDNTRENLREVNYRQNSLNRVGANRNNQSSGVRGVCWNIANKKWEARISVKGKRKTIGIYSSLKDAESAVKKARKAQENAS
jgi:hypothetical protein